MKIHALLLDINNSMIIDGRSIAERVSANGKAHLWNERSEDAVIDTVVIHFASAIDTVPDNAFDIRNIIKIFCDLGVSSHYIIDRTGKIYSLVPEDRKAWHCGGSIMPSPDDRRGVNGFSIGIELVAAYGSGFTKKQYASLSALCIDIEKRNGKTFKYVGHEDISGQRAVNLGLRQDAKNDPGPKFDWNIFIDSMTAGRIKLQKS
jgi:N-acetyl-anhydromuramyl-L-alanine amidase AmpD